MLEKQRQIERTKLENAYLEGIAEDYNTYKNALLKQKQQQVNALKTISEYISESNRNINQSEHLLQQSRNEQREILSEIKKIKLEIQELL